MSRSASRRWMGACLLGIATWIGLTVLTGALATIQPTEAVRVAKNIRVLPIASLIGEAVRRTASEESVSSLFD